MATQPWSTIVGQWKLVEDTTVDPVGGLYGRIDTNALTNLIGASSESDRDAKAQAQLGRMANFYRQKLLDKFQKSYPATARQMATYLNRRVAESKEYYDRTRVLAGVLDAKGVTTGIPINYLAPTAESPVQVSGFINDYFSTQHPRVPFPVSGTPTSQTLANQADNGDFVIDVDSERLYINRGTKAAPNWVRWSTSSLIDYILNPEELLESGYIRTIFYLKGYGTLIDAGDFTGRLNYMPTAQGVSLKEAIEAESLAFGLIDIDASADGVLSDFEEDMTAVSRWVF